MEPLHYPRQQLIKPGRGMTLAIFHPLRDKKKYRAKLAKHAKKKERHEFHGLPNLIGAERVNKSVIFI